MSLVPAYEGPGTKDTPRHASSAVNRVVRSDDAGGVHGVLDRTKAVDTVAEDAIGGPLVLGEVEVVEIGPPRLDAQYLAYGVSIAVPGMEDAIAASLGRLLSRIEPWRADLDYLNFAEHERPADRIFGDRVHRLRAVKNAVDPTRVIRSNHPVHR